MAVRLGSESPLHGDTAAVVIGNLVPIVGVVVFGWRPETLLLVYLAELAAICLWAAVQTLFARKRPNNFLRRALEDSRRRFELLGPLQQKRGATELVRRLPPVYLRNVPTFVAALVIAVVAIGMGFVLFALSRPTVTRSVAVSFLIGGTAVFVGRSVAVWRQFFSGKGYKDHSPRSVLLEPFKYLLVLSVLFAVFLGLESGTTGNPVISPRAAVVGLAVVKVGYDVRTLQLNRNPDRRSWFAKLYGSRKTEIGLEAVTTPAGSPTARFSVNRPTAISDSLVSGGRYVTWNGEVTLVLGLLMTIGVIANNSDILVAVGGLALLLGSVRSLTRYLRYGTLEYHCYPDELVTFDKVLGEPQSKVAVGDVADVTVRHDRVDSLMRTETLDIQVTDPPEVPDMGLLAREPADIETTNTANQSVPLTVRHVPSAEAVLNCLGLSGAPSRRSVD